MGGSRFRVEAGNLEHSNIVRQGGGAGGGGAAPQGGNVKLAVSSRFSHESGNLEHINTREAKTVFTFVAQRCVVSCSRFRVEAGNLEHPNALQQLWGVWGKRSPSQVRNLNFAKQTILSTQIRSETGPQVSQAGSQEVQCGSRDLRGCFRACMGGPGGRSEKVIFLLFWM